MSYYTLLHEGHSEVVEKKSRFLGAAFPVSEEEQAVRKLQGIRQEHFKARHNTYAMIIGEDGALKRSSDDGEPSGTAGAPMLQVLEGMALKNVIVVVTRYFGGTLLGTGGLIRAYSQAAKEALADGEKAIVTMHSRFRATFGYPLLDRVQYYIKQEELLPPGIEYAQDVTFTFSVDEDREEKVKDMLIQISSGAVLLEDLEPEYKAFPVRG